MLGKSYLDLDAILMAMDRRADMAGMDVSKIERVRRILEAAKKRGTRNLALSPAWTGPEKAQ